MSAPVTRVPDDFVPEQADADALAHAVRCLLRERAQLAEQSAAREQELSERLAARKRQVDELQAIVGGARTGDPRDPIELRLEIRRLRRDIADQQVILDHLEDRSRELERARDEQRQRARDLEHALEPFALAVPIAPAFGYGAHLRPDGQWSHSVGGLRAGIAPVHWIRAAVTYVAGTEDDVARLVELAAQRERREPEAPGRCPTLGCTGPGPDVADQGPNPEDAVVIACPSCGRAGAEIRRDVVEVESDRPGWRTFVPLDDAEGGDAQLAVEKHLEVRHPGEALAHERATGARHADQRRRPRAATDLAGPDAGDAAGRREVDDHVGTDLEGLGLGRLDGDGAVSHEFSSAGDPDRDGAATPRDHPQAANLRAPGDTHACGGCGGRGWVAAGHAWGCRPRGHAVLMDRGAVLWCSGCGHRQRPCSLCQLDAAAAWRVWPEAPATGEGSKT